MGLLNTDLETMRTGSHYQFSATRIEALGAAEYTLVTLAFDASGSVEPYAAQLEKALKTVFKSCEKSPRADNLMLRLTQFNHVVTELHGFKLLSAIKEDDYTGILQIGGSTALFDAAHEAVEATAAYGKQLMDQEFVANAIVVICTDGDDNASKATADAVKKAVNKAKSAEVLESLTIILIGVTGGNATLSVYLQDFKDGAGITQYVDIGEATPGKIAKLAAFVSQSISSTSTALGTGQPSQPLVPAAFKI